MPVALLFFWPNYAKIMLVFPNYATFLKLCSSKTMANKSKNTFSLTRSRLLLLATIYNGLWSLWLVRDRHFSERAIRFRSNRLAKLTPFCSLAYERYWDRHGLPWPLPWDNETTPWEFRESTMGLSFSVHPSPRSPFLYSNRRRGVYFIFREPGAAFIRGRRLFKNHFIQY